MVLAGGWNLKIARFVEIPLTAAKLQRVLAFTDSVSGRTVPFI
jgi:hypothetical protein